MDECIAKVGFPLAAKPQQGSGGAGFKRIMNCEGFAHYIAEGTIDLQEYVIQEFIPKGGLQYGGCAMTDKRSPLSS